MKQQTKAQMILAVECVENGFIVATGIPTDCSDLRDDQSWLHVGTSRARTKAIILQRAEELAEELLNRVEGKG